MMHNFGSGLLFGTRTDIAAQTPQLFGVLQDVSVEFSASAKQLFGQNQYPVLVARGQAKIACKAKVGAISANLFNALFFGGAVVAGQNALASSEAGVVPTQVSINTSALSAAGSTTLTFAATAGVSVGMSVTGTNIPAGTIATGVTTTTVTISQQVAVGGVASGATIVFGQGLAVANAATYLKDEGVFYAATAAPLTLVTSAPAQGQYMVGSNGVYNFNNADAGAALLINYLYTVAATGQKVTLTNPQVGTNPVFSCQLYTSATTPSGQKRALLNLHACVASKLALATKIEDFTIPELDFEAFADSAGIVFDWSFNEAS